MIPRSLALAALLLVAAWVVSCSGSQGSPTPGAGRADAPAADPDVPQSVRDTGARIARRLGAAATCAEWRWAAEDSNWECAIAGLARRAELDVESDGTFRELDLSLSPAEIERAAPAVATVIADRCEDPARTFAEISIRAEPLLGSDVRLERLWGQDGIFIEVRCPDGGELELDPFGTVVTIPDHDRGQALE